MKKTIVVIALVALSTSLAAQVANDEEYTKRIRQETTAPEFMTELVDHLPASPKIPTPLKFHGYIAGQAGHLTYAEDVHRYMRALAAASPRIRVLSVGKTEEDREMVLVLISSEENLARLDRYRDITRRLADPRKLSETEARTLIDEGKPFYYMTGAMHSPETGSPEMLMELAYRLIVSETPMIRGIRDNVITMITPVLEVDGRNRQVDLWRYRKANPDVPTPPLIYWGHHVAHDNNRDNMSLALKLSQNVLKTYFDFHPQVVHDLHESVPFLYVSTGTGPYNPVLDPLMIDEWHRMAFHEVTELTKRNLPGVWTHGFYDGWAPNYMFWVGMGHNSIGRFYETFGHRWPVTENRIVRTASERTWFRPNPPLPQVRWSFRNNTNFQQSGVLLALHDMAKNRQHFLEQFYTLGKRSIAKAANEGPSAYVFDAGQKRRGQLMDLMRLLRTQGIEVHTANEAFSVAPNWPPSKPDTGAKSAPAAPPTAAGDEAKVEEKKEAPVSTSPVKFAKGSFIVRMDQPYSRFADTLFDVQFVRGDERVYDDTGWTFGYSKNVEVKRIVNPEILKVPMTEWQPPASATIPAGRFAVENHADTSVARVRWAAKNVAVAEEEFTAGGKKFAAGTIIAESDGRLPSHDLQVTSVPASMSIKTRALAAPRVAIMHTWRSTQDEGWWRLALENLGIPYTYISTQDVSRAQNLKSQYDVIIFAPTSGSPQDIVNGYPPGPPLPWKKSELTPNLGVDETDDMRPGLGLSGVAAIERFVEDGGLLITARDTAVWAIQYGLARWVSVVESQKVKAPGTIVLANVTDRKSPIARGYDETLPIYFRGTPIFRVGAREDQPSGSRPSGRGGKDDPDVPQGRAFVPLPERPKASPGEEGFQLPEDLPHNFAHLMPRVEDRPRVIVSFAKKADQLLMSGMLEGGEDIAGKPAVILSPRGKGNILLFSGNPMWRANTQGNYALVTNALMHWDHLR